MRKREGSARSAGSATVLARAMAQRCDPRMRRALPMLFALAVVSRSVAQQAPELRFAGVFGDHMVVQRDRPLRIWGSAPPAQRVAVQFGTHTANTQADAEGRWAVTLPALPAEATGRDLAATTDRTVVVRDVVVGDVWLCSGQSNMAMGLDGCDDRAAIDAATDGAIRYRPLFEHFAGTPQADLRETFAWRPIAPHTAGGCSAVAYWFAQTVRPVAKVPIGLLHCTVGGTEIECWMPPEAFAAHPDLQPIAAHLDQAIAAWQRDLAAALPSVESWLQGARAAVAAGRPIAPAPRLPGHPNEDRERWVRSQSLWNGMVHPLLPLGVRGVLWYQGENNGHERTAYAHKLRALVATWRRAFGADLPFYYVQLPAYGAPGTAVDGERGFAPCRLAQLECARLPDVGMAVTIDVGDAVDIHPKDKRTVGERLARWALRGQYGQQLVPSGPWFVAATAAGDTMRVQFEHVGQGLMIGRKGPDRGVVAAPDDELRGFALAGADGRWHPALARIDGNEVVVQAAAVPLPVAVRYADVGNPVGCNLYNRDGLPASPFRSDGG